VGNNYKDPDNLDAQLTPHGINQCRELSQRLKEEGLDVDCIISSPMRRALQTAHYSFEHILVDAAGGSSYSSESTSTSTSKDCNSSSIPFVACENWRETVNYVCDARLPCSQLSNAFPSVDFSKIEHEHDPIWKYYEEKHGSMQEYQKRRESQDDESLVKRARAAWKTIAERPEHEQSFAVVSHSAFFMHMFTRPELGIVSYEDGDVEELMMEGFANCEMRSVAFEIASY